MESPGEEGGRNAPPSSHTPTLPQTNGSSKIIGRNVNGTSKWGMILIKTFWKHIKINSVDDIFYKYKICVKLYDSFSLTL